MGENSQSPKIGSVGIAVAASVVFHVLLALIALPAMMRAAAAVVAPPLGAQQANQRTPEGEAQDVDSTPVTLEIELPQFVEVIAREEVRESLIKYLRTTQNESTDPPEQAAFQSDRNTRAASEVLPDDDATEPLPSQRGVDIPVIELATREYVDGEVADDRTLGNRAPELVDAAVTAMNPAAASPVTPPSPLAEQDVPGEETPEPGEEEAVVEDASPRAFEEEFAQDPSSDLLIPETRKPLEILENPRETEIEDIASEKARPRRGVADTPRETYDPLADHRPPSSTRPTLRPGTDREVPDIFQPQTRQSELRGTISNRGSAAADAVDTPMGRYMRKVTSAIEKEWNRKRVTKSDFVTYGNIRLKFYVDFAGKVRELRIDNPDKANPIMQDFTLSAVLEAPIPPIPKNLLSDLTGNRLPVTYDIIIY